VAHHAHRAIGAQLALAHSLAPSFFTRSFLSGKSHVIIFRDIFEVVADATVHFFFFGRGKLVLL
jgi:hypothetical protein